MSPALKLKLFQKQILHPDFAKTLCEGNFSQAAGKLPHGNLSIHPVFKRKPWLFSAHLLQNKN
jgi:hypothetical protein